MKLIIDIHEKDYQSMKNGHIPFSVLDVIMKGTPLPKGHGRLIDADVFQKYCFNKNFDKMLSDGGLATINMFLEFQPTIIEADKGDSE